MLGEKVKAFIDKEADRVARSNPFFQATYRGELTAQQWEKFIQNIIYLIRFTPPHLKRALKKAQVQGLPTMQRFFSEKISEEVGHDKWGEQDVASLKGEFQEVDLDAINSGTQKMLAYHKDIIDRDCRLYVLYIMFAEYFTVIKGEELIGNLEKKCNIARDCASVITKHSDLDREHIIDDLKVLNHEEFSSFSDDEIEKILRNTFCFYEEMVNQCLH